MGRPLFLDRDGVLNVDVAPYVSHRSKLEIFEWTPACLGALCRAGFDLYVVSNQQGVALGITPQVELDAMSDAIQSAAASEGASIRKFYYCTAFDRDRHPWRKPGPGMILSAADEFGFDPTGAFMIGDKWSDIEAGIRGGCRSLLVLSGVTPADGSWNRWSYCPEAVFPTLREATEWIVKTSDNQ